MQFGEHFLGQREMLGGYLRGPLRAGRDHRLGQFGMLPEGAVPDLGRVRLRVEAEADLPPDPGAQLD